MTAAELITQALADAPEITIERAAIGGELYMWVGDTYCTFAVTEDEQQAFGLIRLLLAAAPHIPAVLDAIGPDRSVALRDMRAAIRQAGEQL